MDRLRVGIALYNAGHYLAAHEPLETLWLESPAGERDDCLQGLIQATAAIYKSRIGNATGAIGLAESSIGYISDCEDAPISIDGLVEWLGRLAAEPDLTRHDPPPVLRVDDAAVGIGDLTPAEILVAGEAVAETSDDELLSRAVAYAESDIDGDDGTSPLVALVRECLREPNATVRERLRSHVERRRTRESDVEGLFK